MRVQDPTGRVLAEAGEGIGVATNNQAEYLAVVRGLGIARDLGAASVVVRSDSRLLVEQLAGRYRVKNATLQRLHGEVRALVAAIGRVRFEHVPRERNREADRLANEGVDAWLAGPGAGYRPAEPEPELFGGEAYTGVWRSRPGGRGPGPTRARVEESPDSTGQGAG